MANETYNGWTNYATWRVNLEIFDGRTPKDLGIEKMHGYDAGQCLKSYAEEILQQDCWTIDGEQGKGITLDYAMAFLSEVNWYEIATHLLEEYQEEEEEAA
jgi:hypothetical protein